MAKIGVFTVGDARKVAQATREVLSGSRTMLSVPYQPTAATPRGLLVRHAELTASLSAASNYKTGATTANAKFLVNDPDNPGDLMDGGTFTVTNRWSDLALASGKRILVALVGGEWIIVASECP